MHRTLRACFCAPALALAVAASSAQPSENLSLLGSLDLHAGYNDIWGYADEFGAEFAILGTYFGTSIVDVSDPANPVETGFIPGQTSIWRDMKTYGDYAYIVTEGSMGHLQIVDLSDPYAPQLLAPYTGFGTAHNLFIDESTARAYVCATDSLKATQILDLSNPTAPVFLGEWTQTYVHDLYVRDGIGYFAEPYEPGFSFVDLSDPNTPVLLLGPYDYPGALSHNTWLDASGDILFTTDETEGGHVKLWDISAFPTIAAFGDYQVGPATAIVHNVFVLGDLAYVSYYTEGLRIFEFSDPSAPGEVGSFDTHTPDETGYFGAWGVYPFLPSGNILVSDIEDGLHVFAHSDNYGLVQGVVTESGVGSGLDDVRLEILESGKLHATTPAGRYTMSAAPGAYTLRASLLGFFDQDLPFNVAQGATTPLNVALVRKPSSPLGGVVQGETGGLKIQIALEGAEIELVDSGYATVAGPGGAWSLPSVPHGDYELRIRYPGYGMVQRTISVVEGNNVEDELLSASAIYDDADTDMGWTLGDETDTAISGIWIRAVPVPSAGGAVQPDYDATPGADGSHCFVTGNAPGPQSAIGADDVDNGITTLTSPSFDVAAMANPRLAYARWYVNEAGANPGQDVFTAEISNDDGATWHLLEQLDQDATPWTRVDFPIAWYVAPSATMRVRFIARDDVIYGSIVEALIDDFEVYDSSQVVATPPAYPHATGILSAAPNPFNPQTRIQFAIERPGPVRLDIVDLRGRRVATLLDRTLEQGVYSESWGGRDAGDGIVASGIYLAVLRSPDGRSVRKLSLIK